MIASQILAADFAVPVLTGTTLLLGIILSVITLLIVVAPLFCWSHLAQINRKMDKLVALAERRQLTAEDIGDAVAREMKDLDPAFVSTPERERTVVCDQCGKAIKVAANSKFRPGDTAHCPACKALIRV